MYKVASHTSSSLLAMAILTTVLAACGGGQDTVEESQAAETAQGQGGQGDDKEAANAVAVSQKPIGFGASVTGGDGSNVVHVSTPEKLRQELCHSGNGDICTDDEPRTIVVDGTIDMTASEGYKQAKGCAPHGLCAAPVKTEVQMMLSEREYYRCDGQPGAGMYTYSVAGISGLPVGSNKTLIGAGKNAVIKGKGLLIKNGVSNIIIRNIAFTDINPGKVFAGDGITILDAKKIWIDHNYFARIAREMIVTGDGTGGPMATDVTISNNEFDGRNEYSPDCTGKHYWNLYLAGTNRLTFAGNWLHDFSGREPKMFATKDSVIHLVNNLFENSSSNGHALEYTGSKLSVLVEGNYFDKVTYPATNPPSDPGKLFGLYRQTTALQNACSGAIGRICSGNVATPAPAMDYLVQDSVVLNSMKPYRTSLVKAYSASSVPDTVHANAGVGKIQSATN